MITYSTISISKLDDYRKLCDIVPKELIDNFVVERLQKYIGRKRIKIVIEYPYSEKDYLSTYYCHYSQKFKHYSKKCCRLHLCDQNTYFGYITLRPTVAGTKMGKTYLMPQLLLKEEAYLALSDYKAHVSGREYIIRCFPWMIQETDIAVCAHVSTWTILRYFGNKYKNYSDTTMGELVEKVKSDSDRKTPSYGLEPAQISYLFKSYGFDPIVRERTEFEKGAFLNEIISYIESGIPVVGIIPSKHHAISIIGHGKIEYELLDNEKTVESLKEKDTDIIMHSSLIRSLYVMEDNYFPYRKVSKDLPTQESDVDYNLYEIVYAVVPLYSKMQLVYNEVCSRYMALAGSDLMEWEKTHICRIYITSSNSLKEFTSKATDINIDLRGFILNLSMPRFVWCIDIAGIKDYTKQLTSGRVIIDATCSTKDQDPWILMHDSKNIRYYDEDTGKKGEKKCSISPYKHYINNLQLVNPSKKE